MIVIYICKFDPYIQPTLRRCLLCVVLPRAFRGVLSTDARRCFLGWAAAVQYELRQQADQVSKTTFSRRFAPTTVALPRQARDRHRESTQKEGCGFVAAREGGAEGGAEANRPDAVRYRCVRP